MQRGTSRSAHTDILCTQNYPSHKGTIASRRSFEEHVHATETASRTHPLRLRSLGDAAVCAARAVGAGEWAVL